MAASYDPNDDIRKVNIKKIISLLEKMLTENNYEMKVALRKKVQELIKFI